VAIVAKVQNRLLWLRLLCWLVFVIVPAGFIGWLARVHNIWILVAGIPLMFLVERLFRSWVRWYEFYHLPVDSAVDTVKNPDPNTATSVPR
jgi:Na+/proline symporter